MKVKKGGREGEVEEKWRGEEVDGKVSRVKYDREEGCKPTTIMQDYKRFFSKGDRAKAIFVDERRSSTW